MATQKTLLRRIGAFLAERKKSDGGYAPVDPVEIERLHAIVADLIALKYEADPDGDQPVRVHLTDLTRYERPIHLPVRHTHRPVDNMTEIELHLQAADRYGAIAQSASERASRSSAAAIALLVETAAQHQPLTIAGVPYAVRPPAGATVDGVRLALLKLVTAAHKKAPCPEEHGPKSAWAARLADAATQKLGLKVLARTCVHTDAGLRMHFKVPALSEDALRVAMGESAPMASTAAKAKAATPTAPTAP